MSAIEYNSPWRKPDCPMCGGSGLIDIRKYPGYNPGTYRLEEEKTKETK
jgi:hypothetical protein